jgi:hypothetical protein
MRAGASGVVAAAYTIDNSCRFNDNDSAKMTRTWGSDGDRRITTWSFWVKRCNFTGAVQRLFHALNSQEGVIEFQADDKLMVTLEGQGAGTVKIVRVTTQVFRDPSAWMHIVIGTNRTLTTDASCRIDINGVEVTAYDTKTNPGSAVDGVVGGAIAHSIAQNATGASYLDGYLAQYAIIDGAQLNSSSFGELDSNGNWVPIDITGLTYGDEGSLLDFAVAPGTGNGAGTDVSGEANHYTDSGLAANDQVTDSPTDDAENEVGNYMVLNSVGGVGAATSEGGTRFVNGGGTRIQRVGTMPFVGKTYWEVLVHNATQNTVGMVNDTALGANRNTTNDSYNDLAGGGTIGFDNQNIYYNGSHLAGYSQPSATQRWMFAFDADTGEFWSGVNGTWHNSGDPAGGTGEVATLSTTTKWFLFLGGKSGADQQLIISGSGDMSHTVPTGFTAYMATDRMSTPAIKDPSKYFQVDKFSGTGSELVRTLTNAAGGAVKPDFVWIKDRDTVVEHVATDSARGATKENNPEVNNAESTVAQGLKSFDTSGYTLGTDASYNASSSLNVAWCWVGASGAGSSNEDGAINTTTTSANTTAAFSVSTYTGTGSATTVGHGIGATPDFIWIHNLAGGEGQEIYHSSTHTADGDTLFLDTTATKGSSTARWDVSAMSSTVVGLGISAGSNASGNNYVMYCWAGVEGYSKFSSYEGNAAADGTFVWCGFTPRWIIVKNIDATASWIIFDTEHPAYNLTNSWLHAETNEAESTSTTTRPIDVVSNGFKHRGTDTDTNAANTFIFAAFAEFPFGGDGVSQARAR